MKAIRWIPIVAGLCAAVPAVAYDEYTPVRKTREQVYQELIQAQRDGLLPTRDVDYPPSEETILRNKELYAISYPDDVGTARSQADKVVND
ncbi:DUF4148 domain-containing protein (plasmid) [Burkholderia sp. FERM BP-3421]|jgi:Domain of unknown function (DUF4148)|uniref:DUF4148 domain-containing protein n=1 Tax=Burkholderia sp. FERM BP-3421 TaxID=1494466 RepID=UPI00235F15B4|nr:DUF4148 domain-containing protein [Burkholderia sp. FERM BP-3421]WDD90551.1 DUF4148 domain-containing protein [Burkholderia sp. FERM BP-3421]